MSTELDLEGIDGEESLQGFEALKPGQYHAIVEEVDESREKVAALKVKFQALAGNVAGQVGKQLTETFWDPDAGSNDGGLFAKKRLAKLALATGLIQPSDLGKRGVVINWEQLPGKQLIIHVRSNKRDAKYSEIDGLHMYRLGDASQGHVPLDAEAAAMAGYKAAANGNGGNGNGGEAANHAQSTTADKPAPTGGRTHGKSFSLRDLV